MESYQNMKRTYARSSNSARDSKPPDAQAEKRWLLPNRLTISSTLSEKWNLDAKDLGLDHKTLLFAPR